MSKTNLSSSDKWLRKNPWMRHYYSAKSRCGINGLYYQRIKFLMSKDDFRTLWFRDKAWLLKQPSIDRIDNCKDYVLFNCQFIERRENSRKDNIGRGQTKEVRIKISKSMLGRKKSKEHLLRIGKSMRGKPWTKNRWEAQEKLRLKKRLLADSKNPSPSDYGG